METRKTHFEQIPVSTAKKIAEEFSGNKTADRAPEAGVSPSEDWREIAKRVQAETDSGKMIELVQKLIEKYDETTTQKQANRFAQSPATSPLKPTGHDTTQ